MKDEPVDFRILILKKPDQYAARYMLAGGGRTQLFRLKDRSGMRLAPFEGCKSINEETPEVIGTVYTAAAMQMKTLILNDSLCPQNSKYKTCSEAMEAYLEWRRKNNREQHRSEGHAKSFIEKFGKQPLSALNSNVAEKWLREMIAKKYAYDTVRLRIAIAGSMISWLTKEKKWYTANPFLGLVTQHRNMFKASPPSQSTLTDDQYNHIMQHGSHSVRQFTEISKCTGLRPSEVTNLEIKYLDRKNLTWSILVTKTKGQSFYRTIAVPSRLISYIENEDITTIEISNLYRQLKKFGISAKIFRKDFASRMESVGATPDIINLHQGRAQNGVLYEHYLTDPGRAVRLCRPYIQAMFGEIKNEKVVRNWYERVENDG